MDERRVFLGTSGRHAASDAMGPGGAVAAWLLDDAASTGEHEADLSAVILVVPGARAGRLVLAALARAARDRSLALSPPEIRTPGSLAPRLLLAPGSKTNDASPTAMRLAWAHAASQLSEEDRRRLAPRLDGAATDGARDPIELVGESVGEVVAELRRGDLSPAEARQKLIEDPSFPDESRWIAIETLAELADRTLAAWGLRDPLGEAWGAWRQTRHVQPTRVVLAGVAELDALTRAVLAHEAVDWRALVFAEGADRARFDRFGCPNESWSASMWCVPEDALRFVATTGDGARATIDALAELASDGRDEAEIGTGDAAIVAVDPAWSPAIERAGLDAGRPLHAAGGRSCAASRFGTLLQHVAALLGEGDFDGFHALLRHPDAGPALAQWDDREASQTLEAADRYVREHLPGSLDDTWRGRDGERLERAHRALGELLAPIPCPGLGDANERRSARDWGACVRALMARCYPRERESVWTAWEAASAEHVARAIDEVCALPEDADGAMTAGRAVMLVLAAIGSAADPEGADERPELIGWLETPFEPAPRLVFAGMDDAHAPTPVAGVGASAALLPERARATLKLTTASSRAARDAFLFASCAQGRSGVRCIAARRDRQGNPLWASRFLLAGDDETLVARVQRWIHPASEPLPRMRAKANPAPARAWRDVPTSDPAMRVPTRFELRPFGGGPTVSSMSVTAFRNYLRSPYEFYLQTLRLRELEAPMPELDARAMGTLIHAAAEAWAQSDTRDSTDERSIEACMLDTLATLADAAYGTRRTVALRVQLELAARRLRGLAAWQAAWARQGWRVVRTEWNASRDVGATLPMDKGEAPMGLHGRIDRIDHHETSGAWAVLDYKTGRGDRHGRSKSPEQAHQRGRGEDKRWVDLQLPLYRHLARPLLTELGAGEIDVDDVRLGYVTMPVNGEVGEQFAAWDHATLASADSAARAIVRRVRAGEMRDEGPEPTTTGVLGSLLGWGGEKVRVRDGEDA